MTILLSEYIESHTRFHGYPPICARIVCLIGLAILTLSGCKPWLPETPPSAAAHTPTAQPSFPTTSPSITPPPPASTPLAKIIVGPADVGHTVVVHVNQQINLVPISTELTWQVDYESSILTALTPPDKMNMPGPEGWLFQAVAVGETDLVVTSIPAPCLPGTPCAPMPARVGVTIQVQP